MDISVVIPLYNEDESIPELYAWIERVMKENHFTYEVIFINDGSTDRSWEIICELKKQQPEVVKGIKFRRNYGKSPALYCGFEQAQGDVVITMDADLQDSPDEIPGLYHRHQEPARLQLRSKGVSQGCGEEYRGVWRDASLYPLSGQERRFR